MCMVTVMDDFTFSSMVIWSMAFHLTNHLQAAKRTIVQNMAYFLAAAAMVIILVPFHHCKFIAAHLKIGHQSVLSTISRTTNELQWLD